MKQICPFFFCQKLCITIFTDSLLQNATVGSWVYSEPNFVNLWRVCLGENTNSDILDLGARGGKSSTVTTRHVTASQNWVGNKPKILPWHAEAKNQ